MKKFLKKLYILLFMAITVFLSVVIWHLTFQHIVDERNQRKQTLEIMAMREKNKKSTDGIDFKKDILDTEERVKHYLGNNKILDEKKLEGHFHHIGFDFKPDKQSYCAGCHSDFPHDKVEAIRAFTNMHASFIACETCHVKSGDNIKIVAYKWYDRTTGKIVESPVKEGVNPGAYEAKIIPFEEINGKVIRIDSPERRKFAMEYKENENTLSDIQKVKSKKIIHQIVSAKPHTCEDCHQKEAPLLPFKELGYSQKKIDAFISTEVVGMIRNYTQFYIPRILHPGFEDDSSAAEKQKKE